MRLSESRLLVAAGLLVLLAACKPDYPKCETDEHCAEKGEICVDALCKECSSDEQCKQGFTCQSNACVALPECRLDGDCGEGQRCRDQKCVPECTTSRECASSEKCEANRCVPDVECTADGDCSDGKKCEAGSCVTAETTDAVDPEEAARLARLQTCALETIAFEFNEFALGDAARAALERSAECIRHKKKPVLIGGHADERGTEEYNLVLAEKRANATKRYLSGLGVDESLLRTVSYGEEKPLVDGHDDAAWTRNRRAELSFR